MSVFHDNSGYCHWHKRKKSQVAKVDVFVSGKEEDEEEKNSLSQAAIFQIKSTKNVNLKLIFHFDACEKKKLYFANLSFSAV